MEKYLLSSSEQGILLECLNPTTKYNLPSLMYLGKNIDAKKINNAINEYAQIHKGIFTRIEQDDEGQFFKVCQEEQIEIPLIEIEKINKKELVRQFDLFGGKLYRFELLKVKDDFYLFSDFHHIIADGNSMKNFIDSLEPLYNGKAIEKEQLSSFDYGNKEQELKSSEEYNQAKEYYSKKYSGLDVESTLVEDKKEENISYNFIKRELNISPDAIRKFVKSVGIKTSSYFLGTFMLLLSKINMEKEVLIATIHNGRDETIKNTFGMFVRTLPLYVNLEDIKDTEEMLKRVNEELINNVKNDVYSYSDIVSNLGINPEILFAYQGDYMFRTSFNGISTVNEQLEDKDGKGMMSIEVHRDQNKFLFWIEYRSDIYEQNNINHLVDLYEILLNKLLISPILLKDLELFDAKQLNILNDFNEVDLSEIDLTETILDKFYYWLNKQPNKDLVIFKDKKYTYKEVDLLSNRLANELLKFGVHKEDKVSILISKSEWIVIASLGVIKSGAAYQPLDVSYPKERLNFMVSDAASKVVIAERQYIDLLDEYKGPVIFLDEFDKLKDESRPSVKPSGEDLFIMLYTSGSTGVPKGVMLEHHNIMAICGVDVHKRNLQNDARVTAYASFGFDADMLDLYPTIFVGGTIYIIPEEMRLDLLELNKYINENKITDAFFTTQVGRQLVSELKFETIRTISVGGEKLVPLDPPKNYRLINMYGPTEGSIYCSGCDVDKLYYRIPIGHANSDYKFYVLDENMHRLPYLAKGELYISGPQVGRGYLNRDQENKKAFLVNPFDDDPLFKNLYKTGDIVRFLEDGTVDFIGRKDWQVKIRGFRVELTEVEQIIRQYPGISDATVKDFADPAGVKYIVGYIVSDHQIDIDDLKNFIRDKKPPYMVPPYIMQIDHIPLNQNQKVNKKALPVPELKVEDIVKPKNEDEQKVYDILKEILGHESFGTTTDIYEAGLTSISSITFTVRLSKAFNKPIANQDLSDNPTVKDLAVFLANKVEENKQYEILDEYPLTKTQEGIFIESISKPGSTNYNIPLLFKIDKSIDVEKLKLAIIKTMKAHEYLMTTLNMDDDGNIKASRKESEPIVEIIEKEKLDEKSLVRPFDIVGGYLYRAEIYLCKDAHYLFLDFHHIICDGSSENIILNDINRCYADEEIEKESFSGFELALEEVEKRQSQVYDEAKAYYGELLKDIQDDYLLKKDLKVADKEKLHVTDIYPDIDVNKINNYADKNNLTLNAITNFVFGFTFSKFLYKEDTLFTTIYNGRNSSKVMNTVSMMVKTLPVYVKYQEKDEIIKLLEAMKKQLEGSQINDIYSFQEIVAAYNISSDVMFAYQGDLFTFDKIGNKKAESMILDSDDAKSLFSLDIFIENNKFKFHYEYDESKYNENTINSFSRLFALVLNEIVDKKYIHEINCLPEEDKKLYEQFNATEVQPTGKTYKQLVEEAVEKYSDCLAIAGVDGEFTYKLFNENANKVAHALVNNGIKVGDRAIMLMPRRASAYFVREGILKSGGAFVAIDPKYPDDRIEYIITDSDSKLLISTEDIIKEKADLLEKTHIKILKIEDILKSNDIENLDINIPMDSLAYMIYTSGSTGKPKGVMISQKNLANYVLDDTNLATGEYRLIKGKVSSCSFASFAFDASLQEECVILSHGYQTVIASEEEIENPILLSEKLIKYGVNIMFLTPSYVANVLDCQEFLDALKNFEVLDMGAEAVPYELVERIRKLGINCIIDNGYGPTETTITSSMGFVTDKYLTIGKPVANTKYYILDKAGHILPINAIGDLAISGDSVGIGYYKLEDKTKEKFITLNGLPTFRSGDLARINNDGNTEFFGRLDNQIKLHGLRIELDEIEKVCNSYPEISKCVIMVKTNPVDGDYLALYYTASRPVSKEELTTYMAKSLTPYMIPKAMMQLDKIPLTPNGKVDKKALPEITTVTENKEKKAPRNETEKKLCHIFSKALGLDEVGIDEDFFELGGTSLSASKVAMLALKEGLPIAYKDVFENSTVEELSALINKDEIVEEKVEVEIKDNKYPALDKNKVEFVDEVFKEKDLGVVLLTGAAGFLGIHLLKELIDEHVETYILVRSKHVSIRSRMSLLLEYYFDSPFDEELDSFIHILDADITDEGLKEKLKDINFDTLINSAALVKHFSNDDIIEKINYGGTKNLIEVALDHKARMIQISTLSVAGENIDNKFDANFRMRECQLDIGQDISNKYIHSKFMAEAAMLEAIDQRGLDGKIIRVGNLMSRQSDGEFQVNSITNGFMRSLRGYKALEMFPISGLDDSTDFSPIDEVSKAILILATAPKQFTLFHCANSHMVEMGDVVQAMNACGLKVVNVKDDVFMNAVLEATNDESKSKKVSAIITYASNDNHKHSYILTDNTFTIKALYRLGYKWPITDQIYLEKAIKSLISLEYFERDDD